MTLLIQKDENMIIQNGNYDEALIRNYIQLLKALVTDMEAFIAGNGPSEEILNEAPAIDQWCLSTRKIPCLEGILHHHPLLGNLVPNGTTSQLWLLNEDEGWARTLSRFYRLGQPSSR